METKPNKELKSVAEEDALRKLLTSDEDSEEEEKKSDEENENDEEKKKEGKEKDTKDIKDKDGKQKKQKKNKKKPKDSKSNSSDDFSSDSSDSEDEKDKKKKSTSASNSRSGSPATVGGSNKRKAPFNSSLPSDLAPSVSDNSNSPTATPAKKPKIESVPSVPSTFAGVISNSKEESTSIEDAVRRYLMRKPMTTKELLSKFKNKKSYGPPEKLFETIVPILKKINPIKQKIQGKLYLSIKAK